MSALAKIRGNVGEGCLMVEKDVVIKDGSGAGDLPERFPVKWRNRVVHMIGSEEIIRFQLTQKAREFGEYHFSIASDVKEDVIVVHSSARRCWELSLKQSHLRPGDAPSAITVTISNDESDPAEEEEVEIDVPA